MKKTTAYCYANGTIMKERDLHISPYDLGVLRGYAAFDFMSTAHRRLFHPREHWQRFVRGARFLGLTPPITYAQFVTIADELIAKHPAYHEVAIRTVITGGVSPSGVLLPDTPTFYILAHDLAPYLPAPHLYDTGAKIITKNYQRAYAPFKTVHYIEALRFQKERLRKNAVEILYHNGTHVLECSTANFFIVKNGRIITPPTEHAILSGITRNTVIALAAKNRLPLAERRVSLAALRAADEVFITGSAKHVLPITRIDTHRVGDGTVGTVTRAVMDAYRTHYNRN